jgi:hypothetical protein
MSNQVVYAENVAALQPYFDGLYDGDVAQMERIFHPSCRLSAAPDGAVSHLDLAAYYASVKARPSPRSLNQPRYDAILAILASGEGAATAVLRTARAPRLYTDFLSLLRIDDRWQIVAKTYSWTMIA